jgi:hypothetical protein
MGQSAHESGEESIETLLAIKSGRSGQSPETRRRIIHRIFDHGSIPAQKKQNQKQ